MSQDDLKWLKITFKDLKWLKRLKWLDREKSRRQTLTFWHIREKQVILFYLALSKMLWDKYFLHYDSLKIYLQNIQIEFFQFIMILRRINKGVYSCLFEHANTRKHIHVRVFFSILAHFFSFQCDWEKSRS